MAVPAGSAWVALPQVWFDRWLIEDMNELEQYSGIAPLLQNMTQLFPSDVECVARARAPHTHPLCAATSLCAFAAAWQVAAAS